MPSNVEMLMEMGFPQNRAEKALAKTNYRGIEQALDWLSNHLDDPDIDEPFEAPKGNVLSGEPSETVEAKESKEEEVGDVSQPQSLKCDECGKQLRTELAMQTHAAKTGHSSFSESAEKVKPLTAEEKAKQMDLLKEKMVQKRLEREEKEKREAKEKERLRRTQGKDLTMAKFELEQKEIKQLAEQKRREKAEERAAKQKVLDDIRRDREARAAAAAASKAPSKPESVSSAAPSTSTESAPTAKKEYTECRLQIRLPSGTPLTNTFKAHEPLAAVRLYVSMNAADLPGDFTFMTTFPRKVYTDEDMDKPLTALGLVPSAVIMVTK